MVLDNGRRQSRTQTGRLQTPGDEVSSKIAKHDFELMVDESIPVKWLRCRRCGYDVLGHISTCAEVLMRRAIL
jgi:hypothetical protein